MSRARRLSEIAKANQPVFSSTNGTQWWLADPSSKPEPEPAPPPGTPEPQPAAVAHAVVALQDLQPESYVAQPANPTPVLSAQPELEAPSHLFQEAMPQAQPELFPPPELQTLSDRFPLEELEAPSNLFAAPEPVMTSDLFLPPEMLKPSNGAHSTASEAPRDLSSRLSALKDRFLSLGRKNRKIEPQ